MWPRVGGCSSLGWARKVGKPVARIANGWFCEERKGKEKEDEKRREAQRKETRNGQKDNIESRGSKRGGEIPERRVQGSRRTGWRWSISRFRISKSGPQTDPRFSFSSRTLFHNISLKEKSVYEAKNLSHADIWDVWVVRKSCYKIHIIYPDTRQTCKQNKKCIQVMIPSVI